MGRTVWLELTGLVPYVALLLFSVGLLAFRIHLAANIVYIFLIWNLFLAALPLAASTTLRLADRVGVRWPYLLPLAGLWLLFFPNAPYILTDLLHLGSKPPIPLWYDLGLLLAAAGTGLALGYRSLLDVEAVLSRRFGQRVALAVSVAVLFLSGFGIYLGRFARLNSWDIVTDPTDLFSVVTAPMLEPLSHPQTWGVTLLFGVLLSLGYALIRPRRTPDSTPR